MIKTNGRMDNVRQSECNISHSVSKKVNNYISTKSSEKYKCLKKLRYKLGNAFLIDHDKIN